MKALLLSIALVSMPALADTMVAKDGANEVHLSTKRCEHQATLAYIPPDFHDRFQSAWAVHEGKRFEACWMVYQAQKSVILIYEDGDKGIIPIAAFKRYPGI